jgi:hypothetical protein
MDTQRSRIEPLMGIFVILAVIGGIAYLAFATRKPAPPVTAVTCTVDEHADESLRGVIGTRGTRVFLTAVDGTRHSFFLLTRKESELPAKGVTVTLTFRDGKPVKAEWTDKKGRKHIQDL